jgi:hypothetical protein
MKRFEFLRLLPGALLVIVCASSAYLLLKHSGFTLDSFKDLQEVSWNELSVLDVQSGFVPEPIKELESKEVKMAGFVVPLSDDFKAIKEFLLVPDAMACIHVPPPPMNQMVLVSLDEPMNPQLAYGPVWVKGKLEIKSIQSTFGVVGYQMRADKVKVYQDKNWK